MPTNDALPQRKFYLCTGELVNEDKLYKFPNAHIVGQLVLTTDHETDRTVSELAVYRQSLPTNAVPLVRPPIAAWVSHARHVCCSLCERGPCWVINQSSFMALMSHFGMETEEQG